MTLTQLTYIVALDKFKNFGQAAKFCQVSQPTLSMQIQKLEEEIGLILFDRTEQPIKTTKNGKKLIQQAQSILREAKIFDEMVSEEKNESFGEIRIGVIPTLAPYLIPLFLKEFIKQNSNLKIIIEELQTAVILEKLKDSAIDLALLVTPIESSDLISEVLFYEPFMAYISEKSPLNKLTKVDQKDLNSDGLWLLTDGHCFREQSLLLCKNRKKTSDLNNNLIFESGSLETIKKIIDQGEGFTLLPYLATIDNTDTSRLKEFSQPIPSREVSLIYNKYFRKDKIKNNLIEIIHKSLPKNILKSANKKIQIVDLPLGINK